MKVSRIVAGLLVAVALVISQFEACQKGQKKEKYIYNECEEERPEGCTCVCDYFETCSNSKCADIVHCGWKKCTSR